MPTSKEYRQQAKDCMNLASEAEELFVKTLTEMAADFEGLAEKLQQRTTGFCLRGTNKRSATLR
jgi:hypothetical protein